VSAHSTIDSGTADVIRSAGAAARAGHLSEARAIAEDGIASGCDATALHAMIGWFFVRESEFGPAIPHLQKAYAKRPADPIVVRNLATAFVGCARYGEALAVLPEEALAADRGRDLQRLRGFAAQMAGDLAAAIDAYAQVVDAEPRDWETWNNLGNAKASAGDLLGGISALRRAAELNPLAAPTRLNLARMLRQAGKASEAEAELRLMAKDFPRDSKPLSELADLLHTNVGDDVGAREALEQAVQREPRDPDLLARLGRQQRLTLAIEAAEESFRRALELEPRHADAILGLAEVFDHVRPEELSKLTADAEAVQIDEAPLALIQALTALRERREGRGIDALRRVPEDFEPELRFRLEGQLLDKLGQYDDAFAAFERMNAAHAKDPTNPLRRAAELRDRLREQLQLTTQAWRESWAAPLTSAADAPVFLLGFPRSGTTLLDTMLMGHPRVRVMEERPVMARVEAEIGGFNAIAALDEGGSSRARRRYFEIASEHVVPCAGSLLVDKSPLHLQRLPQIVRLFPNARFILALRHPADVVLSCFMSSFRLNSSMANLLQLDTAAEFYDLSFTMWEESLRLFPVEVHMIVYEKLIEDPQRELKSVVEALGLTWDPRMLDHQRTAKARGVIPTASYAQVTQPLHSRAIGRWRHYRRHLEPVLAVLAPWIEKFGYSLDPDVNSLQLT
jgi:tetratricopeptide (TPR) repeat protein